MVVYSDNHAELINLLVLAIYGHFNGKQYVWYTASTNSGCRISVVLCIKTLAHLPQPTQGACYLIQPKVYSVSFYNITMKFPL
jgi:hypothetical protein